MTGITPQASPSPALTEAEARLGALPRELSWLLIAAGIAGVLLPGPVGTPFLLLGGASLCPGLFSRVEEDFRKWFPRCHRKGLQQLRRYLADMERRYP